jgi:hypothetical protein
MPPDRHDARIGDVLRRHGGTHRPADDPTREQVEDRRDVQPALGCPDVGEVGRPFAVRCWAFELPLQHVRRNRVGRAHASVDRQTPRARPGRLSQ